ncbi:MAG: hypothetical protein ACLGHC_01890 [Alphaproteobacteria bacterium]
MSAALRKLAAINAARPPLPEHHVTAYAARAHGSKLLTAGELWFLESVLRLSKLSDAQAARLLDIAKKVGRNR